jgi:hypothetical protein
MVCTLGIAPKWQSTIPKLKKKKKNARGVFLDLLYVAVSTECTVKAYAVLEWAPI